MQIYSELGVQRISRFYFLWLLIVLFDETVDVRCSHAPEPRHRQFALCGHNHRQRLVHGLALDMPAGEARELPVIMRVRGLRHFSKAKIQPLGEEDVQQADSVAAWRSGSQMGKGVGEADRRIHFQQNVCDPHRRHSTIKIENQFLCIIGNIGGQPVDPQRSIFNAAIGDGPIASGTRQSLEAIRKAALAVSQPGLRVKRNGHPGICLR